LYGYLNQPHESQEEMTRFHSRSSLSAEDLIAVGIPRAESRSLLLDGIRLGGGAVQ
jgi:hypothetical protein